MQSPVSRLECTEVKCSARYSRIVVLGKFIFICNQIECYDFFSRRTRLGWQRTAPNLCPHPLASQPSRCISLHMHRYILGVSKGIGMQIIRCIRWTPCSSIFKPWADYIPSKTVASQLHNQTWYFVYVKKIFELMSDNHGSFQPWVFVRAGAQFVFREIDCLAAICLENDLWVKT